jgi:fimbrial chaperone protein
MISFHSRLLTAAAKVLAAVAFVFLTFLVAGAQSLSGMPVTILLSPGQSATSLTVTNHGSSETAIQIRCYAWNQQDGDDQLTTSNAVVVSPPLVSIAPGATQVVRLILRQPPQGREATYRILLDQIPPPAQPGVVRIVFRLSIPIFAQPMTRAASHVKFHIELEGGKVYLVGVNDGLRHEAIRDIVLSTSDQGKLKEDVGASPYILSGATRRWHFAMQDPLPLPGETFHLTAHEDSGAVDEQVRVVAKP